MPRYLHIYRTPSLEYAGLILEEVGAIASHPLPVSVIEAAREKFPGIEDLPADASGLGGRVETVELNAQAYDLLAECAAGHGVDLRTYIEALANYAISREKHPGAWEANKPFDFEAYDARTNAIAEQWF